MYVPVCVCAWLCVRASVCYTMKRALSHIQQSTRYSAQVDNITLSVDGTELNDDGLVATSGEPVELQIWAGYSVPAPIISVYVDDEEITRQFSYDTSTNVRCQGGSAAKSCPLHYLRSAKALGSYSFTGNQDGSSLIVKTHVTGSGFESINRTIPLIINRELID